MAYKGAKQGYSYMPKLFVYLWMENLFNHENIVIFYSAKGKIKKVLIACVYTQKSIDAPACSIKGVNKSAAYLKQLLLFLSVV